MKYATIFLIFVFFCRGSAYANVDSECDKPEALEEVRIYYLNGMRNSPDEAKKNKEALRVAMGMDRKDFGLSYNDNEFWLLELLEVYSQRQNETDEFWDWIDDMSSAPKWFQDKYVELAGRFMDSQVYNDDDLLRHIKQYKRDLRSGKKVVMVAHSQGNFYANNAYRYFLLNYKQYINSIGIVAIATPANRVQDNGPYTTNPYDRVINLVRALYPDTLPGNVTPVDKSLLNHGFVDPYMTYYGNRIVSHINGRVASLDSPEKAFECQSPEEVPVAVLTNYAEPYYSTAKLYGKVQSGKEIAGRFLYRKAQDGPPPSCWSAKGTIPESGPLNKGDTFSRVISGLDYNTKYGFRACGREGDRISNGSVAYFTTKVDTSKCEAPLKISGGQEGLFEKFILGLHNGVVTVKFNAYSIPDSLRIKQDGKVIYSTYGLVSGYHKFTLNYRLSLQPDWIVEVSGNPDDAQTSWDLFISCPDINDQDNDR